MEAAGGQDPQIVPLRSGWKKRPGSSNMPLFINICSAEKRLHSTRKNLLIFRPTDRAKKNACQIHYVLRVAFADEARDPRQGARRGAGVKIRGEVKAGRRLPPETERQMAWGKIKDLINQKKRSYRDCFRDTRSAAREI